MKYACIAAAIASIVGAHACHAQEGVDKARAAAFDSQDVRRPARPEDLCLLRASL